MEPQNKRSLSLILHEMNFGQDYSVGIKAFMEGNFKLAREALRKIKFNKNEVSKERSKLPRSEIKESLPIIKKRLLKSRSSKKLLNMIFGIMKHTK